MSPELFALEKAHHKTCLRSALKKTGGVPREKNKAGWRGDASFSEKILRITESKNTSEAPSTLMALQAQRCDTLQNGAAKPGGACAGHSGGGRDRTGWGSWGRARRPDLWGGRAGVRAAVPLEMAAVPLPWGPAREAAAAVAAVGRELLARSHAAGGRQHRAEAAAGAGAARHHARRAGAGAHRLPAAGGWPSRAAAAGARGRRGAVPDLGRAGAARLLGRSPGLGVCLWRTIFAVCGRCCWERRTPAPAPPSARERASARTSAGEAGAGGEGEGVSVT